MTPPSSVDGVACGWRCVGRGTSHACHGLNHHLPSVRDEPHGDHARERLHLLLRVPQLRRKAQTSAGRLLRLLLIRHREVPSPAGGLRSLRHTVLRPLVPLTGHAGDRSRAASPCHRIAYALRMSRLLVTGMSGTGKSTVLDELSRRGHATVDTDYDDWVLVSGAWDEQRMTRLLASHPDVIVSGTVENQGRFYDRFEHVVLLSAPVEVLVERVRTRSNNPYGRTAQQRAEIATYAETVEPLLRQGATLELDARRSPCELADVIEDLVTQSL